MALLILLINILCLLDVLACMGLVVTEALMW